MIVRVQAAHKIGAYTRVLFVRQTIQRQHIAIGGNSIGLQIPLPGADLGHGKRALKAFVNQISHLLGALFFCCLFVQFDIEFFELLGALFDAPVQIIASPTQVVLDFFALTEFSMNGNARGQSNQETQQCTKCEYRARVVRVPLHCCLPLSQRLSLNVSHLANDHARRIHLTFADFCHYSFLRGCESFSSA